MIFTQSIEGCLDNAVGSHGLTENGLSLWLTRVQYIIATIKQSYHDNSLRLLQVPSQTDDIDPAYEAMEKLTQGAKTVVFLGTGGSGLGGQTLAQLGGWSIHGDERNANRPEIIFYDNLDPRTLSSAIQTLDLATTRFVITSKSGGTGETLVQAVVILKAIKEAGLAGEIPNLFLGLTEPHKEGKNNGLRAMCEALNIPLLNHDTGVGGRYSCLTNVGLLPAISCGLDVRALRAGAQETLQTLLDSQKPEEVHAAVGAAVAVGLSKDKGVENLVMMPYSDRLARFSAWYVQLWAESLGKQGEGTTPIGALGPVDQHSQLQLHMDGPKNLMVTFLRTKCAGVGPAVDEELARMCGLDYMIGHTVGDLVDAQQNAVPEALLSVNCPVRTIDVDPLNEHTLGGLLMSFMLETILAAGLLGIDPFDQPGVELGKILARKRLGGS